MTQERPTTLGRLAAPLAAAALAAVLAAPAAGAAPQRTPAQPTARSDSDARSRSDADASANARADGNAGAQDRRQDAQTSRQTRSHTRRVVVENGRIVVDEETRDGRPVRRGGAGQPPSARRQVGPRGAAPGPGGTFDPEAEIERMMREMEAEMRRGMTRAFPGGAGARGRAMGPAIDRARGASNHTRRVVVRNGRTVVDEETRDGAPVRGRGRRGAPNAPGARAGGAHLEIERMIRDLEAERSRPAPPRTSGPTPGRVEPLRPTPLRPTSLRPGPMLPIPRSAPPAPLRPSGVTGGR